VAVVAAGVHLAGHGRTIRQPGQLLDRERIHVGAQPDDFVGLSLAATNDADHAGAADAGDDLVAAERLELVGDDAGGAMDVEAELWMGVQVAPPAGDLLLQVGDAVDDRHRGHSWWRPGSGGRRIANKPDPMVRVNRRAPSKIA